MIRLDWPGLKYFGSRRGIIMCVLIGKNRFDCLESKVRLSKTRLD